MADDKKVLMIINPAAGQMNIKPMLGEILELFSQARQTVSVVFTEVDRSATQIVEEMARGYDMIVCCGGDGTLKEVATGLIHSGLQTPVGYIPAGTTNDMASTLEISEGNVDAARDIIDGTIYPHDVGIFNGDHYFNYVASFGAFTETSYETPQWAKNYLGYSAYILNGIKRVGQLQAYQATVTIDDEEPITDSFIFGSVSNATSVAGFLKFDEKSLALDDGLFEVLLIRFPNSPVDLTMIFDGMIRQDFSNPFLTHRKVKRISFEFDEPVGWTVDGEFGGNCETVEIDILRRGLKLVH